MKRLIVITGQTATGKTDLACSWAKHNECDIVSFDARQLYRGVDIVSGKDVSKSQFTRWKQLGTYDLGYYTLPFTRLWLYDIISPKNIFSAAAYEQCAVTVLRHLFKESDTIILVGGTYFYLAQLLYGHPMQEHSIPNPERTQLNSLSVGELQKILYSEDPERFERLNESDRANPRRLIRHIERIRNNEPDSPLLERTYTIHSKLGLPDLEIDCHGLHFSHSEIMRERIRQRVLKRMSDGAEEEFSALLTSGFNRNDPGLSSIGYRELDELRGGKITRNEAVERWSNREYQYARRQYVFMKRDSYISWRIIS